MVIVHHHRHHGDWVSDSSLAGMSAAAFTIFWMKVANNLFLCVVIFHSYGNYTMKNCHGAQTKSCDPCGFDSSLNLCCQVKLEWHSLVFCSLGAIVGMIFGLEVTLQEQRLTFMEIDFALGKKFRLKSGGRHSLDASREEAELCLHLVQLCLRPLPPQQRTQEEDV